MKNKKKYIISKTGKNADMFFKITFTVLWTIDKENYMNLLLNYGLGNMILSLKNLRSVAISI